MCGICGQYFLQSSKQVNKELITRMSTRLYRRGPDEAGGWVQDNIGLGIQMLHIRDYENGRQPFRNEDGTVLLIFNGEIYNYDEIKAYLIKKGHSLFTQCDAEVISHMYEEFGPEFVERINGMFALALFDKKKRIFLLARDRLGIKPLYYALGEDVVIFSSSLRSLLEDKDIPSGLDTKGINHYFSYNYFPCDYTPFKKIKKLLPGHYLIAEKQKIETRRYWQFEFQRQKVKSEREYIDEFKNILHSAVASQMVSDVPVGIFLSGGMDSGSLAYYANIDNCNLKSFSVGFREETFDERKYSRYLNNFLNTRHYEIEVPKDIKGLMKQIALSLDMPAGEGSYVPLYVLSDFARKHVGVALSGEGADELFGGYQAYIADIAAKYCMRLPRLSKKYSLKAFMSMLPWHYGWMNPLFSLELFSRGIADKRLIPHYFWREIFTESEKKLLYNADFFADKYEEYFLKETYLLFKENYFKANSDNFLEQAMFFDTTICLPEGMLHRVDMASMYNSLEVRVPFLDNRLVEFAAKLPLDYKIRHLTGKYLMRKAFKGVLPEKIISRGKHGLSVPVSKWLRCDLNGFAQEVFNSGGKSVEHLINRKYVLNLFKKHCEGTADNGRKLWNMLIFFLWSDEFKEMTG